MELYRENFGQSDSYDARIAAARAAKEEVDNVSQRLASAGLEATEKEKIAEELLTAKINDAFKSGELNKDQFELCSEYSVLQGRIIVHERDLTKITEEIDGMVSGDKMREIKLKIARDIRSDLVTLKYNEEVLEEKLRKQRVDPEKFRVQSLN